MHKYSNYSITKQNLEYNQQHLLTATFKRIFIVKKLTKALFLYRFQSCERPQPSYHWCHIWLLLLLFILIWTVFPFPLFPSYPAPLNSTERHTTGSKYNSKCKTEKKYICNHATPKITTTAESIRWWISPFNTPWNQRRKSIEKGETRLAEKGCRSFWGE